MGTAEGFTKSGKFSVAPDRQVYGELRVAGKETSLYLRDDTFFDTHSVPDGCFTGTLYDLTKVTLIQCVTIEGPGSGSRDGDQYHYAKLFPHFVLEGRRHIEPTGRGIVESRFVIEDATALFYDFDAFGTVIDAIPHIERIATANKLDRPIPIGPEPQIVYFAGKRNIIEADTVLGKVSAQHNPGWGLGGPRGVRIDNVISVSIRAEPPIAFAEAISRTLRLLRFLELIIGRPQNLRDLVIYYVDNGEHPEPLKVHWSYRPSRDADSTDDRRSPQPADLLLDPIGRSEEFAGVMRAWLEKDEERQDARLRFHNSFAHQRRYSVERLVGAANMFDILPTSAGPNNVELSEGLLDAKRHCREIFIALPDSYERSSVLNALGRVGKPSLKHKTRHRAQYVVDAIGERFSDLVSVLDEAIDCRNHYVHGSPSKIDYSQNFDMVLFFTDTLEFVFAAAELIEAGWDIQTFLATPTSMSHPFGAYLVNYKSRLQALKALLAKP
jgi:hypothetical protein